MNHHQMLRRLRIYLDDPKGDIPQDVLTDMLNAAQEEAQKILSLADPSYFQGCVAYSVVSTDDALEFELPTGCRQVTAAERIVSGADPIPATWIRFADRHSGRLALQKTTEAPVLYIRGSKLGVVDPADDYTLRVFYEETMTALDENDDVSSVPSEYHNFVCLHAARLIFASEGRDFSSFAQLYQQERDGLAVFGDGRQMQEPEFIQYIED